MIRDVVPADSTAIAKIYNHYVERTDITFETELIDPSEMLERIQSTLSRDFPWIVKLNDAEEVVGYAYADLWRKRIAYRCSVESAVYVSCDQVGRCPTKRVWGCIAGSVLKKEGSTERSAASLTAGWMSRRYNCRWKTGEPTKLFKLHELFIALE